MRLSEGDNILIMSAIYSVGIVSHLLFIVCFLLHIPLYLGQSVM